MSQLNLIAPFNEMTALRGHDIESTVAIFGKHIGLEPQCWIHGWLDRFAALGFYSFQLGSNRKARGLLWINRFFCQRKGLDDYVYMFLQYRYRKHKWSIAPKSKNEVYLYFAREATEIFLTNCSI